MLGEPVRVVRLVKLELLLLLPLKEVEVEYEWGEPRASSAADAAHLCAYVMEAPAQLELRCLHRIPSHPRC